MNMSAAGGRQRRHGWIMDVIPVAFVLMVLCLIVFPLPTMLLDVALAMNLTLAVLILSLSVYIPHALYLSTFPTILLVATLFRLGLNIATTRQILLHGNAGDIVTAFGEFVVGGDVVVGFVVFVIIAIIQFVVIAKGADRVAEVGARFTLDALPGKQMAIDADLRAGSISKSDAQERRRQVEQTSQFYGAMDGASKFVKGDAIAGLLIAAVNVVGGILIGTVMKGGGLAETASLYTVLTVGDGLVSQIPSLLISLASGILITRVASLDNATSIGADMGAQIASQPKAIWAAAVAAFGFAWVPGFPAFAFLPVAGILGALALLVSRSSSLGRGEGAVLRRWARKDGAMMTVVAGDLGEATPLAVRLAPDLLARLRAPELDTLLLSLRDDFRQWGVPYPGLRLSSDATLPALSYAVDIDDVPVVQARLDGGADQGAMPRSRWMPRQPGPRDDPQQYPERALVTRVADVICRRPWRFLGLQEANYLQDMLSGRYPQLVSLLAERIHLIMFRDVLVELLKAGLHIRNLRAIAEGMTRASAQPDDLDALLGGARQALASQISVHWGGAGRRLAIVVLAPAFEGYLRQKLIVSGPSHFFDLTARMQGRLATCLIDALVAARRSHDMAVLVTGTELRRSLELLLKGNGDEGLTVLAVEEISDDVAYDVVHTIQLPDIEHDHDLH